MRKTLPITGMHCASCVSKVESILNNFSGIQESRANLALKTVSFKMDESVDLEALNNKLSDDGYKLSSERGFSLSAAQKKEASEWEFRLIITSLFGAPLLIISMWDMFFDTFEGFKSIVLIAQLILTTIIILACRPFYSIGFKNLIKISPDMNSLIAIGTSAAYVYSLFSFINVNIGNPYPGFTQVYFESAGVILLFITIGRYLEIRAKARTTKVLSHLLAASPMSGLVQRNGKWLEIPADEIETGDIVRVKPGSKIPVDGVLIEGSSEVDESAITGESVPVSKNPGCYVTAPSINGSGSFTFKAEMVGAETVFSQILRLVEEANATRAPIQSLTDKIASIFVPLVLFVGLGSTVFWLLNGQSLFFGLNIFVSVLIIACPCSLGLATPTALVVGMGIGAGHGIHFKSASAMQNLSNLNTIVFDKTGTLTEGNLAVTDIHPDKQMEKERFESLFASIENYSEHLIAKAVISSLPDAELLKLESFENFPGFGVKASLNNSQILAGSLRFLDQSNIKISDEVKSLNRKLQEQGKTVIHLAYDRLWAGLIGVSDIIRKEAEHVLYKLSKTDLDSILLSGDNENTTRYVADEVGIKQIQFEMLPHEKNAEIRELRSTGKVVAMVGDGINDAPALAEADVGITFSSGTEIAAENSDVVIMKPDLNAILAALYISRKTLKKIKQNLFWAFAYNVIAIPVAMGVLFKDYGILFNPMIAGAAMALSSLSVVTNSLLLKRIRLPRHI